VATLDSVGTRTVYFSVAPAIDWFGEMDTCAEATVAISANIAAQPATVSFSLMQLPPPEIPAVVLAGWNHVHRP
jgi:hypothetical protein